jgi:hypothetical protein
MFSPTSSILNLLIKLGLIAEDLENSVIVLIQTRLARLHLLKLTQGLTGSWIHVREPHTWSNTVSKHLHQIIKCSGASGFALGKPRLNLASDKLINCTNKTKNKVGGTGKHYVWKHKSEHEYKIQIYVRWKVVQAELRLFLLNTNHSTKLFDNN